MSVVEPEVEEALFVTVESASVPEHVHGKASFSYIVEGEQAAVAPGFVPSRSKVLDEVEFSFVAESFAVTLKVYAALTRPDQLMV